MENLKNILSLFSNRELALFTWLLVPIAFTLLNQKMRSSIFQVIKALFSKAFLKIYLFLALYQALIVFSLNKTLLWNTKDYIFWLFTVALVLIFSFKKVNKPGFFKNIIIDSIKITVIIEFIINFYNFSYFLELILLPILVFFSLIIVVSDTEKKHKQVSNVFNGVMSIIGLLYFGLSCYWTFIDKSNFYSISTLNSFLFPIVLTISFLPFLYFNTLYWCYVSIYQKIKHPCKTNQELNESKIYIRKIAKLSLRKLICISNNFNTVNYRNSPNKEKYLRKISSKQYEPSKNI